jgi:hypothetical protein
MQMGVVKRKPAESREELRRDRGRGSAGCRLCLRLCASHITLPYPMEAVNTYSTAVGVEQYMHTEGRVQPLAWSSLLCCPIGVGLVL